MVFIEHMLWGPGREGKFGPCVVVALPGYYAGVRPQVRGWVGSIKAFNIQVIC